jgi:hypothetical protein
LSEANPFFDRVPRPPVEGPYAQEEVALAFRSNNAIQRVAVTVR